MENKDDDEGQNMPHNSRLSPEEERARQVEFAKSRDGEKDDGEETEAVSETENVSDSHEEADEDQQDKPQQQEEEIDVIEMTTEWLDGFFERMQYDIGVEPREEDDDLKIDLQGDDADLLLGKAQRSPRVIEAIETLLSATVARRSESRNIFLDVDGFRQERKSRLEGLAGELEDIALSRGEAVTVAGVDRYERRIIHHTLRDSDDVETESTGAGSFRKVQVVPKS
jgi:spoIIIJ-associated protein